MRRGELAAALLLLASNSVAHGVQQDEGTVYVSAERVVIEREVDEGTEGLRLSELIVRDGDGHRLEGRVVSVTPSAEAGHVLLRVELALPAPARWLSFQLAPSMMTTSLAHRLTLTLTDQSAASSPEPRQVTLTSGGNVETLRFGRPEPVAVSCGPSVLDRHPDRLQGVEALLRDEGAGMRVDVVLPLGILETWLPIARADADILSAEEQRDAFANIASFVESRIRVRSQGALVGSMSWDATFLGLDDAADGPARPPRARDAWTARVRVTLHFPQRGSLGWDLWNARVLTADIVMMKGEQCERRRLSTYAPNLP